MNQGDGKQNKNKQRIKEFAHSYWQISDLVKQRTQLLSKQIQFSTLVTRTEYRLLTPAHIKSPFRLAKCQSVSKHEKPKD